MGCDTLRPDCFAPCQFNARGQPPAMRLSLWASTDKDSSPVAALRHLDEPRNHGR